MRDRASLPMDGRINNYTGIGSVIYHNEYLRLQGVGGGDEVAYNGELIFGG